MEYIQIFESYQDPSEHNFVGLILDIAKNEVWSGAGIEFVKWPYCGISIKSFSAGNLLLGKRTMWDNFHQEMFWDSYMERPNSKSLFLAVYNFSLSLSKYGSIIGFYSNYNQEKKTISCMAVERNNEMIFHKYYDTDFFSENKSKIKQKIIEKFSDFSLLEGLPKAGFPPNVSEAIADFLLSEVK